MIDITLLGTGATMPLPDRALTAVHLAFGGRSILFDCGEGTQSAARKAHVSLMKTDLIALTHYHGDHLFGLPGLLQTFGCLGRTSPLFLTGPDGLEEAMAPVLQLCGQLPFDLHFLHLNEQGAQLSDIFPHFPEESFLFPIPTCHRVISQGYRFSLQRPGKFDFTAAEKLRVPKPFWSLLQHGKTVTLEDGRTILPSQVLGPERKGLSIVFSGDTSPCAALSEAAEEADLFICEATYGEDSYADQAEKYGHCTFSQAARLAADAHAKRLWLAHFSQIMEHPEDFLPNAQTIFPDAVCGSDGLHITLRFEEA
ncbi:MAG: ribonuclease Z [Oscillospiraceae bacterium]|nr:ribonuclease Z [Oscillospiraceae bacterium]